MSNVNSLTNYVDTEGRDLVVRSIRIDSTTIKISWVIPKNPIAYAGAIVVASLVELNASNFPTDSVRYLASSQYGSQGDHIGLAQVVGAFYDNTTIASVTITGIPVNQPIFAAVHLATNVYRYCASGTRSYAEDSLTTAFAGHIDSEYSAPDNPIAGQVYFDIGQKTCFAWSGSAWLPVTAHTSITGIFDPTVTLSATLTKYIGIGNATITNIVTKAHAVPEVWTIMASSNPTIFTVVGSVSRIQPSAVLNTPYQNEMIGFSINSGNVILSPGDTFTITTTSITAPSGLPDGYPKIGDFFYNSLIKTAISIVVK